MAFLLTSIVGDVLAGNFKVGDMGAFDPVSKLAQAAGDAAKGVGADLNSGLSVMDDMVTEIFKGMEAFLKSMGTILIVITVAAGGAFVYRILVVPGPA